MCGKENICGFYLEHMGKHVNWGPCPNFPCPRLDEDGMRAIEKKIEDPLIFASEINFVASKEVRVKGISK